MKLLVKTKIMTQDFYHMSTAECAVQVSDSALGAKGRTDKQSVGGGWKRPTGSRRPLVAQQ